MGAGTRIDCGLKRWRYNIMYCRACADAIIIQKRMRTDVTPLLQREAQESEEDLLKAADPTAPVEEPEDDQPPPPSYRRPIKVTVI